VFSPLAPRIGARTPADLRALLDAPVQPRQHVNPLAQYLAFRDGPLPAEITGTANTPFDRLRMVTLTEFDGTAWTVRANYRRAGTQLPPAPEATRHTLVEADLALRFPDSLGWLPTPGRATTVSVAGLGVDATTGDIVIPAGMATPATYHVAGQQPDINKDELAGDEPAPAAAPLAVQLPQNIALFAQTAIAGQPDEWGRFSGLYAAFQDPAYHVDVSKLAAGGNGLYQISALLNDHKGTSEQYASAFAVLSRHLGWDARVVLGFQPHWDGTRFTARGEDIAAWVEVRFTHLGWVPVYPTPQRTTEGQTQPKQNDDPVRTAVDAQQTPLPPPESPNDTPSPDIPATTAHDDGPALVPLLLAALGAALMLALAVPAAKAIRRWRRRHAHSIRDQATGAWREAVDSLHECRIPIPRNGTTGQVAEAAAHVAGEPLEELATLVDHAVYGPTDLTPAQLERAWQASTKVRQVARRQHHPLARVALAIDPRPLRRIHGGTR
jgi:hypothetical protein